jgi:hypothetical protein
MEKGRAAKRIILQLWKGGWKQVMVGYNEAYLLNVLTEMRRNGLEYMMVNIRGEQIA